MGRCAPHVRGMMQTSHFTTSSCESVSTILAIARAFEHAAPESPGAVLRFHVHVPCHVHA